jgi:hypothetical protein
MPDLPFSCRRWFFVFWITLFGAVGTASAVQAQAPAASGPSTPVPIAPAPACTPEQLHIFIIHGWDPLDLAQLKKMTCCIREWGFPNVCLKKCHERKSLVADVAAIRAGNPCAQFAFIGYSAGANVARDAAIELHENCGIDVRLVVFLSGNLLGWGKSNSLPFVERVIHVRSWDDCLLAPKICRAEMHTVYRSWHYSAPHHPTTVCVIQEALSCFCQTVTVQGPPVIVTPGPQGTVMPQK